MKRTFIYAILLIGGCILIGAFPVLKLFRSRSSSRTEAANLKYLNYQLRQQLIDLQNLNAKQMGRILRFRSNDTQNAEDGDAALGQEESVEIAVGADQDPVWWDYYKALKRRRMLARYRLLLNEMGLPRAELNTLKNLLTERAICERVPLDQARLKGFKIGTPEASAAMIAARDAVERRIDTLVGGKKGNSLRQWSHAYSFVYQEPGVVAEDVAFLEDAGFSIGANEELVMAQIREDIAEKVPRSAEMPGSSVRSLVVDRRLTEDERDLLTRESAILNSEEIKLLESWLVQVHVGRAEYALVREHPKGFEQMKSKAPEPR